MHEAGPMSAHLSLIAKGDRNPSRTAAIAIGNALAVDTNVALRTAGFAPTREVEVRDLDTLRIVGALARMEEGRRKKLADMIVAFAE